MCGAGRAPASLRQPRLTFSAVEKKSETGETHTHTHTYIRCRMPLERSREVCGSSECIQISSFRHMEFAIAKNRSFRFQSAHTTALSAAERITSGFSAANLSQARQLNFDRASISESHRYTISSPDHDKKSRPQPVHDAQDRIRVLLEDLKQNLPSASHLL